MVFRVKRLSHLALRRQCKTEEELVAALQEAEDHPDSCAPACMSPWHPISVCC